MATVLMKLGGRKQSFCDSGFRWNDLITSRLLDGAKDTIVRHGSLDNVDVWAPGSYELPLVSQRLAKGNTML